MRHSPRDCGLALGIPLEREVFLRDLEPGSQKDLAPSLKRMWGLRPEALWHRYERSSKLAQIVAAETVGHGATVAPAARLANLTELCRSHEVVTLIAHWTQRDGVDMFEFADRLVSADELRDAVPVEFSGILDLTICQSSRVGEHIKRARPDSLVVENEMNADLDFNLILYRHVIARLACDETDYLTAMTDLRVDLLT